MNGIVKMLKIQYDDSYNMLKSVVEICPEELWKAYNNGLPVWNNVIHALMGSDFWLRLDYWEDFHSCFDIPENLRDRLCNDEWCSDGFMTKEQAADCFKKFDVKKDKFFGSLDDETLCKKIRGDMEFTYLSVICAQIRHIMCHVGICQDAVNAFGGGDIPWAAFGEN
ncbi:MAG: hypothetical protein NC253_08520 [Ruminococcus sp.]|nr:hypothetical protein [Ruminococcus sp.]MCM1382202.1 hypothetical protein [Muribaculaceae bacterium]MCM1478957.1 hypothetical protein [Muribaculaceae bacterium]